MSRKTFFIVCIFVFTVGIAIVRAQSVAGNASISFKKDIATNLFVLTVKDPDGIQAFWYTPTGKGRIGGELNCARVYVNNTAVMDDPADFTPHMPAYVTDCRGNREDFTIAPPTNGVTIGERPQVEAPQVAPEAVSEAAVTQTQNVETVSVPVVSPEEQQKSKQVTASVAELGNCASEKECRAYCDDSAHMEACVAYAERTHRLSAAEINRAKRFLEAQKKGGGPGGCTSPDSCVSYCEDIARIDECLLFAEENNFLAEEELADARRAAKAKRDGVAFPGGCTSKRSCDSYCGDAAHGEECLAFAEKTGFLPPEKLAEARKMMEFLRRGETPGGCNSEASCNTYCEAEDHFTECVAFAEKAGFMTSEEARVIREAGGKGPGGCKSKTQCETFCNDPAHLDECIEFGVKAGLVKPEEAEMVRKAGGKGPGDCRSKESCEAYCADSAHSEECVDFAMRAGLIKPEEAEMVRKAGGKLPGGCRGFAECQAYCMDPAHQDECAALIQAAGIQIPEGAGGGIPGGVGGAMRGENLPPQIVPDIPVSIPVTGAGAPDVGAIKKQIEEQYKAQIPAAPPGYEAEYERQKQLIEEQYRQQYQQMQQQFMPQ